jgi:hypothetical protein
MLLFTNYIKADREPHMHLRILLLAGALALLLGGCAGGYSGDAKVRWEADQALLDRAAVARRAGDFEAAAVVYEQLWAEATQPCPPEGILGSYFTVSAMNELCREWPEGRARFTPLERPVGDLIEQGKATRRQCMAWTNITTMFPMDDRIASVAEALRASPDARKALDLDPFFRKDLMKRLRASGRDDLAMVYAPSAAAAIGDALADNSMKLLGAVASPVLGPLLAPR